MAEAIVIVSNFLLMSLGLGLVGRRPLLAALLLSLVPLWAIFFLPYFFLTLPIVCIASISAAVAGAVAAHFVLWLRSKPS